MKQRNHAFDLLCGICIIRMISLHVMQFCGLQNEDWWQEMMDWTYFFMSFFFFKAGYFNKTTSGNSLAYCKDRAKRLLVPYLTAGTIGNIIYFAFYPFLIEKYKHPIEPLSWAFTWERSQFYGNIPCWFLFSFFAAYIMVHFIEKVKNLNYIVLFFPSISYLLFRWDNPLWMSLDNVFIGVYFFYLGKVWHMLMDKMNRKTIIGVSGGLIILFIIGNILWHGQYSMSQNQFEGMLPAVLLNTSAILCGLAGLLIVLQTPRIPLICYIGEHSMVYFISHYPMLYFYKFTHLCFGRSIFGRVDDAIILLPAIFMICSWLVPYVERTPLLSGRWNSKASVPTPDNPVCV